MTCKVQSIPPSRHPEYYQSLYYNRFFRPPYWRDLLPLCHLCHFSCAAQERIADERRRIMQPPSRPLHFIAFIIGQDKSLSVRRRSVTHVGDFTLYLLGWESGQGTPSACNESGQHGRPRVPVPAPRRRCRAGRPSRGGGAGAATARHAAE